MRILCLKHVRFEGPEQIAVWANERGHSLVELLSEETAVDFPKYSEFDMLVVMGGPMGTYEEQAYPWLAPEKRFIARAIRERKLVLGICLGAQLIAEAIGGKVTKNTHQEIGWYPVQLTAEAPQSDIFKAFPRRFTPFHWHGDTFRLPPDAKTMATSEGCANQAFLYKERVVGLQFHLESSHASVVRLIEHCASDLEPGLYVQQSHEMLDDQGRFASSNEILYSLLDAMESQFAFYRNTSKE
jgi:GMP synthase-like glutamine amidotransferase